MKLNRGKEKCQEIQISASLFLHPQHRGNSLLKCKVGAQMRSHLLIFFLLALAFIDTVIITHLLPYVYIYYV